MSIMDFEENLLEDYALNLPQVTGVAEAALVRRSLFMSIMDFEENLREGYALNLPQVLA